MNAPRSILEQFLMETQATFTDTARFVNASEEVLSKVKLVAQRIDERCRRVVESDEFQRTNSNRLVGLH